MSSFDMLGNEEFERQALVIKNSHPIAWNALKLSDYCSRIPYGNKKKAIKYIKEEISKYISGPLLDKFTNLDNIDLQESTMVANMLSMPSNISIFNYILASIFKENFYYNEMIEMIEKGINKREELINSFEIKVERLLQLTGELDSILSTQCPKYKNQALVIGEFIDEEFQEFSYLSEDVGSYVSNVKSNIHSGIKYYTHYYESIRYDTAKRYSFCKELLPIDKIIDKYYTDEKQQLINNMTKKLKKINTILNQKRISIDIDTLATDAFITDENITDENIIDTDVLYLRNQNSNTDDHLIYLYRMQEFIIRHYKENIDCPLYTFYSNRRIVLSMDLSEYKKFLLLQIDIQEYWNIYFKDIEFFQMAMILIANKIHYDNLCKEYTIMPHTDGGISFLLDSFSNGEFNIFSKEIESDIALLNL
jgi:hypothetical protein